MNIDKATLAAITAYVVHFEHLMRQKKRDRATLDLTIALRLRVTGHAQEHIESAVRAMAKGVGGLNIPAEADGYARRIAAYPFGKDGEADYERFRPSRLEWVALEEERLLSPADRARQQMRKAAAPARPIGKRPSRLEK